MQLLVILTCVFYVGGNGLSLVMTSSHKLFGNVSVGVNFMRNNINQFSNFWS